MFVKLLCHPYRFIINSFYYIDFVFVCTYQTTKFLLILLISTREVHVDRWLSVQLSGRASTSGAGGCGFGSLPRHTKGVKKVPVSTLLGA